MVTDSQFHNLPESFGDSAFINEVPTPNPEKFPCYGLGIDLHNNVYSPRLDFGSQVQSFNDDSPVNERLDDHESKSVFKLLDQILMEENMDEKGSMFHDQLALQATEKSFYDVIDKKYPPSPYIDTECPNSLYEITCEPTGSSSDPSLSANSGYYEFSAGQFNPSNRSIQPSFTSSEPLVHSGNSEGQIDSFMNVNLIPSQFSDSGSKLLFWKGVEEARKFLPSNNELVIDFDKPVKEHPKVEVMVKKVHSSSSRGKKNLHRQYSDLEARSSKQSAFSEDEVELSEMFDNFFIRDVKGVVTVSSEGDIDYTNGTDKYWKQNRLPRVSRKLTSKNQGAESEDVYLQSLLLSCAQDLASDDLINAHEQLKQIRRYASSTGDACQRVANVFANGLEARLAGTGAEMYAALASKRISASQKLKAYQVYLSACPFNEISTVFPNIMILKLAAKASTLHIVDFGISYEFQWPFFIQFLSIRQGGPPKLRITGINFPQVGFRPAELIEETGQRLTKLCKRFNVPFEYQAIARHSWDTIDINDLNLARDEVLVVNCFLRFHNLPEETVLAENPKDGVLKLIRSMKPDLFVHFIVNGSYNAPFFLTRFREAFFHYASLFDMLDVTLPRNDNQRLYFEQELYGREVVNIIACEGKQRVVRPETYKQWQSRSERAGFKILPLEKDMILKDMCLKRKLLEAEYHKDFLLDEDCNWMLQGWKGRVMYATSCWVPA